MRRKKMLSLVLLLVCAYAAPSSAWKTEQGAAVKEIFLFLEEAPEFSASAQVQLLAAALRSEKSRLRQELKQAGVPANCTIQTAPMGDAALLHLLFKGPGNLEVSFREIVKILGAYLQKMRDAAFRASLERHKRRLEEFRAEQKRLQEDRARVLLEMVRLAGTRHLEETLSQKEDRRREIQASLKAAEKEKALLSTLKERENIEIVASRTEDATTKKEIQRQVQEKEADLRELLLKYTDEFPAVIEAREDIQQLKKRLSFVMENPVFVETFMRNPRLLQIQNLQIETEIRVLRLQEEENSLTRELQKMKNTLPSFQPLRETADALLRALQAVEKEGLSLQREIKEMESLIGKSYVPRYIEI